jgi:hypothetical protein
MAVGVLWPVGPPGQQLERFRDRVAPLIPEQMHRAQA